MRIPLINPVDIVISRLDRSATWTQNPPGDPTTGYDDLLQEPINFDNSTTGLRVPARQNSTSIRVPCQVEIVSFSRLRMFPTGDAPDGNMSFVCHRVHLEPLGLIDSSGNCLLKEYDIIDSIDKHNQPGVRALSMETVPLYIHDVQPQSWGAGGSRGFDLYIIYTRTNPRAANA